MVNKIPIRLLRPHHKDLFLLKESLYSTLSQNGDFLNERSSLNSGFVILGLEWGLVNKNEALGGFGSGFSPKLIWDEFPKILNF